jgi:hypothetical protein
MLIRRGEQTVVVCSIPLCPSRLELAGELTPDLATEEAKAMRWWTSGFQHHVCPSCRADAVRSEGAW